ncbi:amidohydrolase family protein [Paenibacillus kribbensis]|uniref:amidohydrolase family protein n=1 Tax=Paenibacillus kribbensis TaxID=172713 RepID=UPI000839685E|nr:amidohydrolase family protein [Paenibacillus kribbensis]
MEQKPFRIDVHHHIIPEVYRAALETHGVSKSGGMTIKKWVPEDSLELMDRLGIQAAIGSISEPGLIPITKKEDAKKNARQVNEFQAEMIQKYPNRFGGFAVIPLPDVDAALEEIRYALDVLKLDGVGLLTNYQEDFLGDPIFDPIFDELNKRQAVVHIHPSSPPASYKRPKYIVADFMIEFTFNTTRATTNLILGGTIERCPDLKIILSHGGGTIPFLKERISSSQLAVEKIMGDKIPNLKKNAEEYMKQFYYDTALITAPASLNAIKATTDVSHILYGSDAHYAPEDIEHYMNAQLEQFEGFSKEQLMDVTRNNALELFPRFNM